MQQYHFLANPWNSSRDYHRCRLPAGYGVGLIPVFQVDPKEIGVIAIVPWEGCVSVNVFLVGMRGTGLEEPHGCFRDVMCARQWYWIATNGALVSSGSCREAGIE